VRLPILVRQGMELKREAVICVMRNVYWIASEEIALLKYQSMNELVKMQGCDVIRELNMAKNAQYLSHQIAEEMLEAINLCIEETVDAELHSSPFVGVMVDDSKDIATESNMIAYATTFANGEVTNHFLKLIRIEGQATGEQLYKKFSLFLETKGITLNKVSGLSTDGARAMTGLQQGLTGYMKRSNPFIGPFHCIAHRLSLVTSQASKGISYLQRYKRLLISVYLYFNHSLIRVDRLREIQTVLDSPLLKYKPLYDVCWLSFHDAVLAVQHTFPALMAYFGNEASHYDDPVAMGLTKQISSFQFIATTNLLCDVLDIVTRLSKIFQGASINFSIIQPMVNAALVALQPIKVSPGPHLASFLDEISIADGTNADEVPYHQQKITVSSKQKDDFESVRVKFIDEVAKKLTSRFTQVDLMTAMTILDPSNLSEDDHELASYGDEIKSPIERFAPVLH
jgi:hypothetical protein